MTSQNVGNESKNSLERTHLRWIESTQDTHGAHDASSGIMDQASDISNKLAPFLKSLMPDSLISPIHKQYLDPEEAELEAKFTTDDSHHAEDLNSAANNFMARGQRSILLGWKRNKAILGKTLLATFLITYTIYLGFAIAYSLNSAISIIVITAFVITWYIYVFIRDHFGNAICKTLLDPLSDSWDRNWDLIKWFLYPTLVIGLVLYLCLFVVNDVRQLQSISGFIVLFLFNFLTSKHPNKVVWRPVIWGYSLQFIMAILVLQWEPGFKTVDWLANLITRIINFAYEGAAMAFGDPNLILHPFAFMGMPLVIYMGSVMSIMYYYGITQSVAIKVSWLMQVTMKTTAIETLAVTSNILLSGMDVMMMLRVYLDKLTLSEFNTFCVGCNATIAGFVFGLLILFGAPPQHLLTGAVMSAPATIAITKLNWPETTPHLSKTKDMENIEFTETKEVNVFDAAANGSAVAGKTVMTVLVNYVSFIAILALLDASLHYVGERVGFPELSFEWCCSILFWPLALLLGIEVNQCQEVAKLIGIKVFTTEIYGYQELGRSYARGFIDERSRAITTYALCGFCSLSTLAIAVGIWEVVCPHRRRYLASVIIRQLVQANISCFTTACVAGLFYSDKLAIFELPPDSPLKDFVQFILGLIPSYKDLMAVAGL